MTEAPRISDEALRPLSILHTKLYMPRAIPNPVARERLVERLEEGSACKLTLVSAPPGFGKTTLVSEWLRESDRNSAWVSLDDGDNDPVRFLSYLTAALRGIDSRIGETALTLLGSRQPPPAETILTCLINDVLVVSSDMVVVLDDYHIITAQPIHDAMVYLLDHLPETMHLVLTSRVDPPLPLARLRGRRQLAEIRSHDLRFTATEAADFLNELVGLNLSPTDVAALEARTEGWIAGLQLAALSMQNRSDVSRFIQAFTGSHRHIVDYLAEEVLLRQTQQIQQFLMETSILDRLYGPLCNAVTSNSDSAMLLSRLEEANLFIIPLDEERSWYRYHHLFADFLRNHLDTLRPGHAVELHRRAGVWYESAGMLTEAIRHAVAGNDLERAVKLVQENSVEKLLYSEITTLRSWLILLPQETIRTNPGLSLVAGWVKLFSGQIDAVGDHLRNAEEGIANCPMEDRQIMDGHLTALRAYLARSRGELDRSIQLSRQSIALLPAEETLIKGSTTLNMGFCYLSLGEIEYAGHTFADAIELNHSSGNIFAALAAVRSLARLHVLCGKLHTAMQFYQRELHRIAEYNIRTGRQLIPAGLIYLGIAELLYEWNRLDEVDEQMSRANVLNELSGDIMVLRDSYIATARIHHARGEHDMAFATLSKGESLIRRFNAPDWIRSPLLTYRVRLQLAIGDMEGPNRWMSEQWPNGPEPNDEGNRRDQWLDLDEVQRRTYARVLIAQGRHQEALELLDRLILAVETAGRNGSLIMLLNLRAIALDSSGEPEKATRSLMQALTLGQPEGYVRTFLDDEKPLARLLEKLARTIDSGTMKAPSHIRGYLHQLLSESRNDTATGSMPTETSAIENAKDVLDHLSDRELEVLRLVATGLSNKDIAEQLFVAPGTIKRHIHNIYEKLGATSRTHAVAHARKRGLL